jgi:hypothetical protein
MSHRFFKSLTEEHSLFKEASLSGLRIKHAALEAKLEALCATETLDCKPLGKSNEGRNIYRIKAGEGKKNICIFSQMHGNESTGTRVIIDLLNFFLQKHLFQKEIGEILQQCTIHFIPMVNPDGADNFSRYNAFGTDINRDAEALQTAEGKILMQYLDEIRPDFVYSLHDQPSHYAVSDSLQPVAFSFLASAYNTQRAFNANRKLAAERIVSMVQCADKLLSGRIAKYSDDYMPNAYGDKMQEKGFASVLIETGFQFNDLQKEGLRALHFAFLAYELLMQASEYTPDKALAKYEDIPFMKKEYFFDILIRNVRLKKYGQIQKADVGIERKFLKDAVHFSLKAIGDLSRKAGYFEINGGERIIEISVAPGADATDILKLFSEKNQIAFID